MQREAWISDKYVKRCFVRRVLPNATSVIDGLVNNHTCSKALHSMACSSILLSM